MSPTMSVVMLVSLLILVTTTHGIRMDEQSLAAFQKRINDKGLIKGAARDGDGDHAAICKDGEHCSGSPRKLMAKRMSLEGINGDAQRHRYGKEGIKGKEFHTEVTPEVFPDMIDIEGMDYSPAKRKPPIHN